MCRSLTQAIWLGPTNTIHRKSHIQARIDFESSIGCCSYWYMRGWRRKRERERNDSDVQRGGVFPRRIHGLARDAAQGWATWMPSRPWMRSTWTNCCRCHYYYYCRDRPRGTANRMAVGDDTVVWNLRLWMRSNWQPMSLR